MKRKYFSNVIRLLGKTNWVFTTKSILHRIFIEEIYHFLLLENTNNDKLVYKGLVSVLLNYLNECNKIDEELINNNKNDKDKDNNNIY